MSRAIKCDRCGVCFDPEKPMLIHEQEGLVREFRQRVVFDRIRVITPEKHKDHKTVYAIDEYDLCPMCGEEFIIWQTMYQDRKDAGMQYERPEIQDQT